ncbi:HEAT repeat protein-like protein [Pyrenochaeta sp. MPI-SDFR-AT-0127]|nr:HEAT repeat protein-like protein [Pyrenochaeta sp. MPI-SDFR-AT-0127]
MEGELHTSSIPVSENVLRDLAKNVAKAIPNFAEKDPASGVKELHRILDPVIETADLPELETGHRAAASNALCAVIERVHTSGIEHVRAAVLDDSIWLRIFNIYLQRSGDAKGKSMRQILLLLTSVITKDPTPRAFQLRKQAATTFLAVICQRQDRVKVKPALQGLAHFLLRDVVSINQLVDLYAGFSNRSPSGQTELASSQCVFKSFLAWVVHHDTALSAGHVVKNFLLQARRLPDYSVRANDGTNLPLWIKPVVQTLHDWPDRMQEFRTHVFPHCFQPGIDEYMRFLSYLHFDMHVQPIRGLPNQLHSGADLDNGLAVSEEFRILLATIEAGKELTIIRDNDIRHCKTVEIREGNIYLPDHIFGNWMMHSDPEVRLAGMFLSVYSTSVTKTISGSVFRALKYNLIHLHTDTDANFRREIHGYTQKLFDRLRASTATLSKGRKIPGTSNSSRLPFPRECFRSDSLRYRHSQHTSLMEALAFVIWYLRFLEWEMRSTASYQRRITALRSMIIVLRSGVDPGVPFGHLSKSAQGQLSWAHGLQIANTRLIRVLLDLILDPFDDVRDTAISVLQLCLIALPESQKEAVTAMLPRFVSRAETAMLRTGRADQADGVARAYGLIFSLADESATKLHSSHFTSKLGLFEHLKEQLDSTLEVARNDLSEAVNGRPVHGIYAALRYVVDQPSFYAELTNDSKESFVKWKQLQKDVLSSIELLWSYIYQVLCADAPEGHVPDELEDEASVDTKEILSYSWRALKEASTLLRIIISKAPIGHSDRIVVSPEQFERLGRLCFIQLLELRHRGAFSTVSQTFSAFCRRCVSSDISTIRALPELWYQETLLSIQDKADAITRRSAGIPALMSGIMAAEPPQGPNLFSRAMKDLITEASVEAKNENIEESRLPQVHALNCIKEIFTTSRLSVASEAYIGQGLELAAKTLNSNIWPIRNCSLMLFKALIERLLGSDEAQDWKERERGKTSRFSYDNYPSLVKILFDLLDPQGALKQSIESTPDNTSPMDLHGAEGVFPGLQILRQARPPDAVIQPMVQSVEKLLASPHWHLRDMAARTIVSLLSTDQLYRSAVTILKTRPDPHNMQHGHLLAVKYMIKKMLQNPKQITLEELDTLMVEFSRGAQKWYIPSDCPFIRSTFLDMVSLCGMSILQRTNSFSVRHTWKSLTTSISIGPQYALGVNRRSGAALLRTSLAHAFFIDRAIIRDQSPDLTQTVGYQDMGDALALLSTRDPDTCSVALETLDTILQMENLGDLAGHTSIILMGIYRVVLSATEPEVLSKAQSVLAVTLARRDTKSSFFKEVKAQDTMEMLSKLEAQCLDGPPSNMQSALYLLGYFLDFAFHAHPEHNRAALEATARYVRLLRMTIIDTNPFDTRFAAIQSINALDHIWGAGVSHKETGSLTLALSFILYDLLNDDDDEIRDAAALATAKFLRAQGYTNVKDTVPILITQQLATFLCTTSTTSPYAVALSRESLRRLTATPSPSPLFSIPFARTLADERKEDTALFATEKQNLYKDDSLDAVLWSRVLASQRANKVPQGLQDGLTSWVLDGLAVLTDTARKEVDGSLGWSSKSEVFTLGIRAICAAEVVLRWSGCGNVQAETRRAKVMKALRDFADVGEKAEVHGLWLERVERVLEKQVLSRLGAVKGSLLAISGWESGDGL